MQGAVLDGYEIRIGWGKAVPPARKSQLMAKRHKLTIPLAAMKVLEAQ